MTDTPVYIIRTSDRIHFKRCRRAWDINSKIRQNLEPVQPRQALEFGTAIHSALETYYDPAYWAASRDVVSHVAVAEFLRITNEQRKAAVLADGSLPDDLKEDFDWRLEYGPGMLEYFFEWAKRYDDLTPVYVELEFEVPIYWDWSWGDLPGDFSINVDGQLVLHGMLVVYQGRVDMIARDSAGRYWIVDHKTAARLDEWLEWLELDEQCTSYGWAIKQMLGIDIYGILYSEHVKDFPKPPELLSRPYKGRILSTNKNQGTSLELFEKAIEENAEDPTDYEDYLHYLRVEGKQYIRRTPVPRSDTEFINMGRQIALEAVDMLNNPSIYPNPNKFSCKWCDNRFLCLAMNDGSDTKWIIQERYRHRD